MSARTKQWTGRIKQAAASLTGNRKLEREGRAQRRSGEAEQRIDVAKGKVGAMIDRAAGAVKNTIGKGKRP
jgi:uncharacterized protein YjbJ (UPF0337 family)